MIFRFGSVLFPSDYPLLILKYAYNPPKVGFFAYFWRIITRFFKYDS